MLNEFVVADVVEPRRSADREPLADKLAKLRGFAEDVIAKVR